eukprot:scaffold209004_cov21-Tisochrysis_lutea.AAC.2
MHDAYMHMNPRETRKGGPEISAVHCAQGWTGDTALRSELCMRSRPCRQTSSERKVPSCCVFVAMRVSIGHWGDLSDHRKRARYGMKHWRLSCAMMSGETGETWNEALEAQLCYEIKTFLLAGHETSAAMLTWSCFELSQDPHILGQFIKAALSCARALTSWA